MPPQETKQKHPFNLSDERLNALRRQRWNFTTGSLNSPVAAKKLEARKAELRKRGLI